MQHIKDLDDLKGKTVKNVDWNSGTLIIAFTDDSFCLFEAQDNGEELDVDLARYYNKKDLAYVDLITHEQFCALVAEDQQKEEEAERRKFEELKAKYGN